MRRMFIVFLPITVSPSQPEVSGGEAAAESAVLPDDIQYPGVFGQNFLRQQRLVIRLLQKEFLDCPGFGYNLHSVEDILKAGHISD